MGGPSSVRFSRTFLLFATCAYVMSVAGSVVVEKYIDVGPVKTRVPKPIKQTNAESAGYQVVSGSFTTIDLILREPIGAGNSTAFVPADPSIAVSPTSIRLVANKYLVSVAKPGTGPGTLFSLADIFGLSLGAADLAVLGAPQLLFAPSPARFILTAILAYNTTGPPASSRSAQLYVAEQSTSSSTWNVYAIPIAYFDVSGPESICYYDAAGANCGTTPQAFAGQDLNSFWVSTAVRTPSYDGPIIYGCSLSRLVGQRLSCYVYADIFNQYPGIWQPGNLQPNSVTNIAASYYLARTAPSGQIVLVALTTSSLTGVPRRPAPTLPFSVAIPLPPLPTTPGIQALGLQSNLQPLSYRVPSFQDAALLYATVNIGVSGTVQTAWFQLTVTKTGPVAYTVVVTSSGTVGDNTTNVFNAAQAGLTGQANSFAIVAASSPATVPQNVSAFGAYGSFNVPSTISRTLYQSVLSGPTGRVSQIVVDPASPFTAWGVITGATPTTLAPFNWRLVLARIAVPPAPPPPPPPPSPPPPSPPPPPFTPCPVSFTATGPVCGSAGDVYRITDFLLPATDNRTNCEVLKVGTGVIGNCSAPLFPGIPACGSIASRIEVYFKRIDQSTAFTSNIGTFLTNLGLQSATSISQLLLVQNSDNIPQFAPNVFPNLVNVGSNLFVGSFGAICNPLAITSLPFTNLQQVGGKLTVDLTSLVNLQSFAALTCVGSRVRLSNNPSLTSLDGLGLLSNVGYSAPTTTPISVNIVNSPLQGRPALFGVAPLARCNASIAQLSVPPSIQVVGCANALTTWSSVCTYLQTLACP